MRAILLFVAALSSAAQAAPAAPSIKALQSRWMALNEECRGGSHTPKDRVCRARDGAENALRKRGWCWAYSDDRVMSYQYLWHPCRQARP